MLIGDWRGGGGGGQSLKLRNVEFPSYIFIVDRRISLLSELFIGESPYKYSWD